MLWPKKWPFLQNLTSSILYNFSPTELIFNLLVLKEWYCMWLFIKYAVVCLWCLYRLSISKSSLFCIFFSGENVFGLSVKIFPESLNNFTLLIKNYQGIHEYCGSTLNILMFSMLYDQCPWATVRLHENVNHIHNSWRHLAVWERWLRCVENMETLKDLSPKVLVVPLLILYLFCKIVQESVKIKNI